jgi:uncharacterized protein YigE (DUF2233 family)
MSTRIFFVAGLFASKAAFSQVQEKLNYLYNQQLYDICMVRIEPVVLEHMQVVENTRLTAAELKDSLEATGKSYLALNAAPTNEEGNFLGLYISRGSRRQSLNTGSGNGNFFLKPNGVWCADKSVFRVLPTDKFTGGNWVQAVQSGPMLLVDNQINPSFDRNSANRNIRLGIGVFSKGGQSFLIAIRSQSPVTFYEFAQLFRDKFGCRDALYLEGSERSMMLMPSMRFVGGANQVIPKLLLLAIQ